MGFRFRLSQKILPGVRLNFSLSGISASVGGSGLTTNFSKSGIRNTIGLPGNGISYSMFHRYNDGTKSLLGTGLRIFLLVVAVMIGIFSIGVFYNNTTKTVPKENSLALHVAAAKRSPDYVSAHQFIVTATALNCRIAPTATAKVVKILKKNDIVLLSNYNVDGWVNIKNHPNCWISRNYVVKV